MPQSHSPPVSFLGLHSEPQSLSWAMVSFPGNSLIFGQESHFQTTVSFSDHGLIPGRGLIPGL